MKVLKAWRRTMLSILASMAFLPVVTSTSWVHAQDPAPSPAIERGADGLGYYAPGYEPGYGAGQGGAYGDPYGGYGGYGGNCPPTPGEAFMDDMDTEGAYLGGHLREALCLFAPYTAGGICAPRWYDFSVESLFLDRDTGRNVTYMANGLNAVGGAALSSNDLNFANEGVMRMTFAAQVGPAGLVEFSYMGLGNWSSAKSVTSSGDLFSPFSQFGLTPAFGFDESDQASFASLAYSSTFDSYELNLRRRWQSPTCRFQGSYLVGVRHFRLEEQAIHHIDGRAGSLDYVIGTANALTGFQMGGELYISAIPGILFGGEAKGGIYGNAADQVSTLTSTGGGGTVTATEAIGHDQAAFVGEAGLHVLYRLSQHLTVKAGYQCLYVSSVALAVENANFAPASLAGIVGTRNPSINVGGDVFYHGAVGGLELSW